MTLLKYLVPLFVFCFFGAPCVAGTLKPNSQSQQAKYKPIPGITNEASQEIPVQDIVNKVRQGTEDSISLIADGNGFENSGRYETALKHYRKALELRIEIYGEEHKLTSYAYMKMGCVLKRMERYDEALYNLNKSYTIRKNVYGEKSSEVADALHDIGWTYQGAGEYRKALDYYSQSLQIKEYLFGENHIKTAMTSNNMANTYRSLGDIKQAESIHKKVLEMRLKEHGSDSKYTAYSYSNLADIYKDMGNFEKAIAYYQKAHEIREKVYGENSLKAAYGHRELGTCFLKMGQYKKAEEHLLQSYAIRSRLYDSKDIALASSFHDLGWLYKTIGEYGKAQGYYEQALLIKQKAYGDNNIKTAMTLNNIANLHQSLGHFKEAMAFQTKALEIRKETFGPSHPDVAMSLLNLAKIYRQYGNYEKAYELSEEVITIRVQTYGAESLNAAYGRWARGMTLLGMGRYAEAEDVFIDVLKTLNRFKAPAGWLFHDFGYLYSSWGKYELAHSNYQKALELLAAQYGNDSIKLCMTQNNLANVYTSLGDSVRSEALHKMILEKRMATFGEVHPDVAMSLGNIGDILEMQGDYEGATRKYVKALTIREHVYGEDSLLASESLSDLGWVSHLQDNEDQAEKYYRKALEIKKTILPAGHHRILSDKNALASIALQTGDYGKAIRMYEEGLSALTKIYGLDSPRIAGALLDASLAYKELGEFGKAEEAIARCIEIRLSAFEDSHPSLASAYSAHALIKAASGDAKGALALISKALVIDQSNIYKFQDATTETRLLNYLEANSTRLAKYFSVALFNASSNAESIPNAYNVWLARKGIAIDTQKRRNLNKQSLADPKTRQLTEQLQQVREQLSDQMVASAGTMDKTRYKAEHERLLDQKRVLEEKLVSLGAKAAPARHPITLAEVTGVLPPDSMLIDFVKTPLYNLFDKAPGGLSSRELPAHYLAFVVSAGSMDIRLVNLGPADKIDDAVKALKGALHQRKGSHPGFVRATSEALYNKVVVPLEPFMGTTSHIFISPDGLLSLIPFEILHDPDSGYLVTTKTFNYLSSSRDIVTFNEAKKTNVATVVLVGDPDFDLANKGQKQEQAEFNKRGLHFVRLPSTKDEIVEIRSFFDKDNTVTLLGKEATEQTFINISNPKIIHLATHGFFFSPQRSVPRRQENRGEQDATLIRAEFDSMLRSGIAFAGANTAFEEGTSQGIATAEELMAMDLRQTELVVLSACETGSGDVVNGQGVMGLRRSFITAGAKSMVMSMWNVPDLETKKLMVFFYENMIKKGMDRSSALRKAMLKTREESIRQYGYDNPYYWGGFVFLGNSR